MTEQDQASAPLVSPLSEAQPDSLDELFARYDKHIADRATTSPQAQKDIEAIVAELRRMRVVWAEAEAKGATRAPKAKKAKTQAQTAESLADLGLE